MRPSLKTHSRLSAQRHPVLTAVIVNYESWPDALRLAETLSQSTAVADGTCDIVVVDNASTGPVPWDFRRNRPGIRLIARSANGGFSAGVNTGWRASRSPWLLVLNPDVVVGPDFLGSVLDRVSTFESQPAIAPGLVGFGLLNPDGSRQPSVGAFPTLVRTLREQFIPRARRKYQPDSRVRPGQVPWVTGACMLVNTRLLDVLGGMDEDLFLYYEDVALCRTAGRLGWRVEYDPSLTAIHLRPLQNRPISAPLRFVTRHSKLLYFRNHLPWWQFRGLTWIVTIEALAQTMWATVTAQSKSARLWAAIGRLARAFRAGTEPRGPAVLELAEAAGGPISRTATTLECDHVVTADRTAPPLRDSRPDTHIPQHSSCGARSPRDRAA